MSEGDQSAGAGKMGAAILRVPWFLDDRSISDRKKIGEK
jgi:hypothetical protein